MHEILDASISALIITFKMSSEPPSAFPKKRCDVAGLFGLFCVTGCGCENAAQVRGDVVGHTNLAGSEIRALEPTECL